MCRSNAAKSASPTFACCLLSALVLSGCGTATDAGPVAVSTATVRVAKVVRMPMREVLSAYGMVDDAAQSQFTVSATAEVIVDQIAVSRGQRVTAGMVLVRLRNTASSVQELDKARVGSAAASRDLARTQRLFGEHLATRADLDTARRNADDARAAATSADARIGSSQGRTISAPRAGTVLSLDAARGDVVAAGGPLLHLSGDNRMDVRVGIEPVDAAKVGKGQRVVLHPVYDAARSIEGVVTEMVARIDRDSRLAQALVSLPDAQGLLPGSGVRAEIEVSRREDIPVVPRSAVLGEGARRFVFVVADGRARRTDVVTGADDGQRIEIVSGLAADAVVATEGNHELEDGMNIVVATPVPVP